MHSTGLGVRYTPPKGGLVCHTFVCTIVPDLHLRERAETKPKVGLERLPERIG